VRITRAVVLLLLVLVCLPALAQIILMPSGRLCLTGAGRVSILGANPTTPVVATGTWFNATMTSNLLPSPYVATTTRGDIYAASTEWKAFEHNLYNGPSIALAYPDKSGDIILDLGAGITARCNEIRINQGGAGAPSHNLKNYLFYGSADGSAWTTLATGTITDTATQTVVTFSNTTGYRHYKLGWTDCYHNTIPYLYEVQLWGTMP